MAPRIAHWRIPAIGAAMLAMATMGALATGFAPQNAAGGRISFEISTGPTAGTYYPIGQTLADLISHPPGVGRCETDGLCGPPGLIATARASEGSVANVRAVHEGRAASALAQADVVAAAAKGQGAFKGAAALDDLRVLANLYVENVHLVAAPEAGVTSLADLRRKRVSIGPDGSGTSATAREILGAARLLQRVQLAEDPLETAIRKLEAGELDAFFFVGGAPVPAIADLVTRGGGVLVPIAGEAVDKLAARQPALVPLEIPAGAYPDTGPVATLGVGALWIVSAQMPEEVAFAVTRALWHPRNREMLAAAHPQGAVIRPETAQTGLPVPLHPGAALYYQAPPAADVPAP